MSVYDLIEKVLADLNQTAVSILNTANHIAVLRDALKAADNAKIEEAKKLEEGKAEE